MQLNAITRKSALMALMLLIAILVAIAIRHTRHPFAIEISDSYNKEGLFYYILAFLIFFAVGIIEGKILPRTGLSNGFSTLPIPLYGVLACGIFINSEVLVAASVSFCFALAILLLLRSLQSAGEKDSVFFAAMLLGTMPIIYTPSIVLLGVLPLAILLLALSVRQITLMIVGYLLPFFGASYVLWYTGDSFWSLGYNLIDNFLTPQIGYISEFPYVATAIIVCVLVILIWGGIYAFLHPNNTTRLSRERCSLHLFIWLTVIVLTMLIVPACNLTFFSLLAVPVAILLSFTLGALPNNHSTIAYWVLLALFALHLFIA